MYRFIMLRLMLIFDTNGLHSRLNGFYLFEPGSWDLLQFPGFSVETWVQFGIVDSFQARIFY